MIYVTKLNGSEFLLNVDLIQTVQETPDTVITLTTGTKYIVTDSCEKIREKVIEYKKEIYNTAK